MLFLADKNIKTVGTVLIRCCADKTIKLLTQLGGG
jgi:hypothetical protein